MRFQRSLFLLLQVGLVFLLTMVVPYRLDYHFEHFTLSPAIAFADDGDGDDGGGDDGGGDDGGGDDGGDSGGDDGGGGNGNGGGNGGGNGNGNGDAGGNGNGDATGGINGNQGFDNAFGRGARGSGAASPAAPGANVIMRHPDGITERIQNGRYEMQDASGRTIINRAATRADRARIGG